MKAVQSQAQRKTIPSQTSNFIKAFVDANQFLCEKFFIYDYYSQSFWIDMKAFALQIFILHPAIL